MSGKVSEVLPPIPEKRYFTIGEVSGLCAVKPHVLRYWEQEFSQLKPNKRRGNRRYYQRHEVLLIRHIRELLYEQGFTIQGARNRLNTSATTSNSVSNQAQLTLAHLDKNLLELPDLSEPLVSSSGLAINVRQSLLELLDMLEEPA